MTVRSEVPPPGSGEDTFLDRIGLSRPLFWGFIAVLIFMIGDGIETNYLAPFLADNGLTAQLAGTVITIYGVTVAIGAWLSGVLSTIWGPRRVMWLASAIWIIFEVLFLTIGLPSNSFFLIALFYGLRGFAYPMFGYAFLLWVLIATPVERRSRAAGWFWVMFAAAFPSLGALVASISIGLIGGYGTLWLSLVVVAIGAAIGCFAVRERHGMQPIVDESNPEALQDPTSYRRMFEGLDILWRDPRVAVVGIVRMINTAPQIGLFVFFPFVFTQEVGFSLQQYLTIITIVFLGSPVGCMLFGPVGDKFGWRRTTTFFGCVGCAIAILLFYFVPVAVGDVYWVAVLVGLSYTIALAGFVPLSAIAPSITASSKDRGNAVGILNLGAGVAVFVGPAIYTVLNPFIGPSGVVIVYSMMYVVAAILSWVFFKHPSDPGEGSGVPTDEHPVPLAPTG